MKAKTNRSQSWDPIIRIFESNIKKKKEVEKDQKEVQEPKELVPKQFYKQLKIFEKRKCERIPTRKVWNHAINLRECFVPKKQMVQNYRYLNSQTVKNNYPLSLISGTIDTKKVFTKLDLRWRYNNVRIKKINGRQNSQHQRVLMSQQ